MKSLIHLDDWCISVDWDRLYGGDSFFVPSVNVVFDGNAIDASAEQATCVIAKKVVVEDGVQGIRVWVLQGVL